MINVCNNCGKLLEEGDKVITRVSSTYHVLKSQIAYALDKNTMEAVDPLTHMNCQYPKGTNISD